MRDPTTPYAIAKPDGAAATARLKANVMSAEGKRQCVYMYCAMFPAYANKCKMLALHFIILPFVATCLRLNSWNHYIGKSFRLIGRLYDPNCHKRFYNELILYVCAFVCRSNKKILKRCEFYRSTCAASACEKGKIAFVSATRKHRAKDATAPLAQCLGLAELLPGLRERCCRAAITGTKLSSLKLELKCAARKPSIMSRVEFVLLSLLRAARALARAARPSWASPALSRSRSVPARKGKNASTLGLAG